MRRIKIFWYVYLTCDIYVFEQSGKEVALWDWANIIPSSDFMEATASISDTKSRTVYRCKKCRRIVASQENVVPHKQGEGEKCFKWKKRGDIETKPKCSSIFVEPLKWMEAGNF